MGRSVTASESIDDYSRAANDDGAAFRLAVARKMHLDINNAVATAFITSPRFDEPVGDDPAAALRRAIVRAAIQHERGSGNG